MMLDDLRTIAMLDWLENDLLLTIVSSEPASSDASFRRYFRIKAIEGQFIVMDAPPEKENIEPFIRVAELLANSNVNVPTIFQQNLTEGFLLLEDFGSHCFLDQLTSENVNTLYQSALDALFKLQSATHLLDSSLPLYNQQL
jgi:aminoglycoside/choline kinase family phosphotransferase